MIIKEILFENFRSFFSQTTISLNEGFSLFIGDNGDGKTTFLEALEWLFNTETNLVNETLISRKKISQMSVGDEGVLKVAIKYEHDGIKILEKSFLFEKLSSNPEEVRTYGFEFSGWYEDGSQRYKIDGRELLNRNFDASIRQYSLFKGEDNLSVFSKSGALNYLVETFSNVRRFKPLLDEEDPDSGFLHYAENKSRLNYNKEMRKDTKNSKEEIRLRVDIESLVKEIHNERTRLKSYQDDIRIYSDRLREIETSSEAANRLNDINTNLTILRTKKSKIAAQINESYSTKLLDDMWILVGFLPIVKEYQNKINLINRKKRELENEHNVKELRKETLKEIGKSIKENNFIPLEVFIPDEATMREMISEEVCKVCGRDAHKGSDAYLFMMNKLEELLENQLPKKTEKKLPFFPFNFLRDVEQINSYINYNLSDLNSYDDSIKNLIELNNRRKEDVSNIDKKISELENNRSRLLAENAQYTEAELINAQAHIKNWYKGRYESEINANEVKTSITQKEQQLKKLQGEYDNLAKDTNADTFMKIHTAIRKIKEAFEHAREKNTKDFLKTLELTSNKYLEKLNQGGFHGVIKVSTKFNDSVGIELRDANGLYVATPNQALETTMYLAVLFAVSELTSLKRENDYPLIFDAPTSSFGAVKENDFFKVISSLDKQIIILSKSFLDDQGNLEKEKINGLNATVHRIEKATPFDQTNLSTIQTIIKTIK